MISKDEIIEVLKTCYDPEIPIDLWNLGLIYKMKIHDNSFVEITMTLTTPGCSMANHIADDVKNKLLATNKIKDIEVNITFDPPWTPEMLTEDGKIKLGFKENKQKNKNENWE